LFECQVAALAILLKIVMPNRWHSISAGMVVSPPLKIYHRRKEAHLEIKENYAA
jgi:hypothetical protein